MSPNAVLGALPTRTRSMAALALVGCLAVLAGGCTSSTGDRGPLRPSESDSQSGKEEPQSEATQTPTFVDAESWWDELAPEEQVASVLMLHYPGTDTEALAEFVDRLQPGGMILMEDNIPDDESSLTNQIPVWANQGELPLLVAIDQEGGVVSRLEHDPGRSAVELRDGDPEVTEVAFRERGEYLRSLGINVNFGVIADTTDDQDSFIWTRVLGSSPDLAAQQVAAAVRGESGEVLSALKHFPGHGTVKADSHKGTPVAQLSEARWLSSAAVPFEAGIEAGADMVMMGHLVFPKIASEPASISPTWHRILRDELGFTGVIVTDDMKMLRESGDPELEDPVRNAVEAINAGSGLILDVGGAGAEGAVEFAEALVSGLVEALENNDLDRETLRNAGIALLELRAGLRD